MTPDRAFIGSTTDDVEVANEKLNGRDDAVEAEASQATGAVNLNAGAADATMVADNDGVDGGSDGAISELKVNVAGVENAKLNWLTVGATAGVCS